MSAVLSPSHSWPQPLSAYAAPARNQTAWQTHRGALISLLLHAVAVAALAAWSTSSPETAQPERTITLVIEKPAPEPLKLTQPKVETKVAPPEPRKLAAPRPVRTERTLRPRTVAVPAAAAQVAVPAAPAAPTPTPSGSVAEEPAAPSTAPAAPTAPHVVEQDGIPSDYVNQVFSRINRTAGEHYPRIARLKHLEGRVGYRLTLAPDGSLIRCDIRSSGDETLDAAAAEAIRAAAPFPQLPQLGGSAYVLSGAIVYRSQ